MNLKKIVKYLLFLLPWFLSTILFPSDNAYYTSLNLPFFAPPPLLFGIIWPIIYILLAISIYQVWDNSSKSYKITLLINYILNQLFTLLFFNLKNNFFAFADTLFLTISTIYLYYETKSNNKKASKYLIIYLAWNIFATLLSLSIYLLNI